MKIPYRNREFVTEAQQKALSVETRGIARNMERKENAEAFVKSALTYIQSALENGEVPYEILPKHRDAVLEHFRELLRMQYIAVSKAMDDHMAETIFDPSHTEKHGDRMQYLIELLATALENVIVLKANDARGFRQALYRDADWLVHWFDGTLVESTLRTANLYTEQQIKEFLEEYTLDNKLRNINSNVKNPSEAALKIADNYFRILSDENIGAILKDRDRAEVVGFLARFSKSYRMDFSARHVSDPEQALRNIATQHKSLLEKGDMKELLHL